MQNVVGTSGGFRVVVRGGHTGELVTEFPKFDERTAIFAHPTDRAVVLGSMQQVSDEQRLRCETAGFSVVRRRSGGGAIVIDPLQTIWLDLFLPSTDPLYRRDVRGGSFWVGELWAKALGSLAREEDATGELVVHREGVVGTVWSKSCCFLGHGPGELISGERKVVGLSQRRERTGAWFFSLAYRSLDADRDAHLLAPSTADEDAVVNDLSAHVGVVDSSREELERVLTDALSLFG